MHESTVMISILDSIQNYFKWSSIPAHSTLRTILIIYAEGKLFNSLAGNVIHHYDEHPTISFIFSLYYFLIVSDKRLQKGESSLTAVILSYIWHTVIYWYIWCNHR